ncbi:hypothetical protein MP228_000171 [Amoeboaphelidium protococcarum]|nr:hypothetical protein MP228_000171 [Amoeboaphelidium protococcarum]
MSEKQSDQNQFEEGDQVQWKWGRGKVHGEVQEKVEGEKTIKSKGHDITRKGDSDNPAYVLSNNRSNNPVIKKGSELQPEE